MRGIDKARIVVTVSALVFSLAFSAGVGVRGMIYWLEYGDSLGLALLFLLPSSAALLGIYLPGDPWGDD